MSKGAFQDMAYHATGETAMMIVKMYRRKFLLPCQYLIFLCDQNRREAGRDACASSP